MSMLTSVFPARFLFFRKKHFKMTMPLRKIGNDLQIFQHGKMSETHWPKFPDLRMAQVPEKNKIKKLIWIWVSRFRSFFKKNFDISI